LANWESEAWVKYIWGHRKWFSIPLKDHRSLKSITGFVHNLIYKPFSTNCSIHVWFLCCKVLAPNSNNTWAFFTFTFDLLICCQISWGWYSASVCSVYWLQWGRYQPDCSLGGRIWLIWRQNVQS
jgi:hypothetical protein